jgi:alkanesulfonate monooxygenase SsuD/methylene tetrahydromethanopterin reductase-like flavin-dependent oxidoreductase (luciferase family)
MALQFGIFDHLEYRQDVPLGQLYDERLEFLGRADELGFYAYHLAEHHQSRLCMAPTPAVFLGAVARGTRRLRMGPLVYQTPLHHPLRLIEEICMLDQLSGGRLEVGVGRGITALEHTHWGLRPEDAQARHDEVLDILALGLTGDTLNYQGRFHQFDNVEIDLAPVQRPHPPFWYPGSPEYAARRGMNFIGRPGPAFPALIEQFRSAWQTHQATPQGLNPGLAEPFVASSRHLVIADTDAEAEALARASWPVYDSNFDKRGIVGPGPETQADGSLIPVPAGGPGQRSTFETGQRIERVVTGSPETIAAYVQRYADVPGSNYFIAAFQWGNLTHAQALRSLELFGTEVMPRVSTATAAATA